MTNMMMATASIRDREMRTRKVETLIPITRTTSTTTKATITAANNKDKDKDKHRVNSSSRDNMVTTMATMMNREHHPLHPELTFPCD